MDNHSSAGDASEDDYQPSDLDNNVDDVEIEHAPRPGRYRGPKSTYLSFISSEKELHESLLNIRGSDLSSHLYNVHKLKSKYYDPTKKVKDASNKDEWLLPDVWVPNTPWTAWPLAADEARKLTGTRAIVDDGLDAYTFRAKDDPRPSALLEDLLSGLMIKAARERFEARDWEQEIPTREIPSTQDIDQQEGAVVDAEMMPEKTTDSATMATEVLNPIIALDDQASFSMLRPNARHILERLDCVLVALHNTKSKPRVPLSKNDTNMNQMRNGSDSKKQRKRKSPNAGHLQPKLFEIVDDGATPKTTTSFKKSRHIESEPAEGETQLEWLTRLAKRQKKSIATIARKHGITVAPVQTRRKVIAPITSITTTTRVAHVETAESEKQMEWLQREARKQHRTIETIAKRHNITLVSELVEEPQHVDEEDVLPIEANYRPPRRTNASIQPQRQKYKVRDWSQILGAAALAGLPNHVIQQTTQRCANLFGEGMDMLLLSSDAKDDVVQSYIPDIAIHDSDKFNVQDFQSADDIEVPKIKIPKISRYESTLDFLEDQLQSSSDNESSNSGTIHKSSKVHVKKNIYHCPVPSCERYHMPFESRTILRRHCFETHKQSETAARRLQAEKASEALTEDGLHVDGFLQIIDMEDELTETNNRKGRIKYAAKRQKEVKKITSAATVSSA